ncbi:hypothetical protein D3C81_1662550 [compost metagenome]
MREAVAHRRHLATCLGLGHVRAGAHEDVAHLGLRDALAGLRLVGGRRGALGHQPDHVEAVGRLHHLRHQILHRTAEHGHLLDHTGAQIGILGAGHHKERFNFIRKLPVYGCHLHLIFKVRNCPQSFNDDMGVFFVDIIHQQIIKAVYFHIGDIPGYLYQKLHPLLHRE